MQVMNAAHLPDDPAALKELIVAFAANVAEQKIQIADQAILIEELTEQVRLFHRSSMDSGSPVTGSSYVPIPTDTESNRAPRITSVRSSTDTRF